MKPPMRIGLLVTSVVVLILAASSVWADEEPPKSSDPEDRIYSLLGHGASVELRAFQWVGEDQLIIRLSFQTRSYHGQVIRLIATGDDRLPVLEIKVAVSKRSLRIHAEDFIDSTDKTSNVHFPDSDISDGQYHLLSITVDPNGDLLAELDGASRSGKIGLRKTAELPLDVTLYIGGNPGGATSDVHSIVGCVGKFSIGAGPFKAAMVEEKRSGDVDDGCLDACTGSGCAKENPSGCLNNYLETICDCVGTQKEGAFCSQEPKVYNFDGGQYIAYDLGQHENERQPARLHVSFKSELNEEPMLLLYAPLASEANANSEEEALVLIVNKDSIEVRLRGVSLLKSPSKHQLNNVKWHDLTLEINYPKTEITLKLDNERFTSAEWSNTDAEVAFREVYFGGYKTENVAKGFRGCLRSLYVGYQPISNLIAGDSTRLTYGKEPLDGSCQLADFDDHPPVPLVTAPHVDAAEETQQTTTEMAESTESSTPEQTEEPSSTTEVAEHDDLQEQQPIQHEERHQHHGSTTTTQAPMTCDQLKCQHDTRCVQPHSGNAQCDCRGSGYVGKLCQFSNLPRTCDELFESGEQREGVFRIDPDGNGPHQPVEVKCQMSPQEGGITYVDHNFVNGTYVRQAQKKDATYTISYRNMSAAALTALNAHSDKCEQYFRFECNEAPINLHNSTWFRSAQGPNTFSAVGGSSDDKQCTCGRHRSCGVSKCACDIGDKQSRFDEGYNSGLLAGITEMTFVQSPSSAGWAKVALGPLVCRGSKGTRDVIQFRKSSSYLKAPAWKGQSISFWFRTTIKDGRVFSQPSNNGRYLNLELEEGHTLTVYLNLRKSQSDVAVVTRVVSQSPINDAVWHKVKIETVSNQIRFSIDDRIDAFYTLTDGDSLDDSTFDKELIFGGSDDSSTAGFVGCFRQLIINDEVVTLSSDSLPDGIIAGCQAHCQADGRCFNNAECIEDYENDGFRCKCKNEYTFRGEYCETDINQGTEVSLHSSAAFISVRDFSVNPVENKQVIFSFRTDQPSALLLFAHDDKYNMVQIHLVDGNRISLTVNYERELKQCTIVKKGQDFNNMHWFQVVVTYAPDHTALFVDKDMCQIDGGRKMSHEYLDEWLGDIPKLRVVYPPRSPVPPSQMPSYSLLFVGGVRKQPRLRNPRQSSQIVYTSPLPNLLGCVRGFMVGGYQLDLLTSNKTGNVKNGCNVGCGDEEIRCEHEGYCTVDWTGEQQKASCDCAPTSYFGPQCSLDQGLYFDGNTSVQVQLELILQRYRLPDERAYDSLSFAFSTSAASQIANTQLLAFVQVNAEKDLKVYLTPDGQLSLEIRDPGLHVHSDMVTADPQKPYLHTFNGRFSDAQRHFVFLKFFGDKLVAKVDRRYHETHRVKWRLTDVRSISIGGGDIAGSEYVNYRGCMSNALIDFRSTSSRSFKPFDVLLNPSGAIHEGYIRYLPVGNRLDASACAQYTVEHPMPVEGPATALPPFTEPMQSVAYVSTGAPAGKEGGGTGGGIGIAIALAVIVLVVLLCLALYLYYAKCIKPKRRRAQYQQPTENNPPPPLGRVDPEKQLFLPSPDDSRPGNLYGPRNAPGMTALPEANEDLDDRSNRGSLIGRPPTASSPPPPYAPTATPPLTPSQAAAAKLQHHPATTNSDFAPAPTDEELKALTPSVRRNPSTKRGGAFVYGFPDVAYSDAPVNSAMMPSSPRSPKSPLAPKPSIPRRMPVDVPIPKI